MLIINIPGRKLRTALIVILAAIIGIGLFALLSARTSEESVLEAYLSALETSGETLDSVEVFDVVQGKVIKRLEPSPDIRAEALGFLRNMTGVYVKVKAFPDKGTIIKIPVLPAVTVNSKWLSGRVDKLFVIVPGEGAPYLMVLDEKNRPLFFNFKGSITKLEELIAREKYEERLVPDPFIFTPESRS